jgi:hypothetical protein
LPESPDIIKGKILFDILMMDFKIKALIIYQIFLHNALKQKKHVGRLVLSQVIISINKLCQLI